MSERLPPGTKCVVCDDDATGNHYSVPSCNGCKTFFRRACVNNRTFACSSSGNCPVNKGVRCACRHCRLKKCLAVGMNRHAIQNDRDRIGYTKRSRKQQQQRVGSTEPSTSACAPIPNSDREDSRGCISPHAESSNGDASSPSSPPRGSTVAPDAMLERLTQLENNFTLLLSRAMIEPYANLDDGLAAPCRFLLPITVKSTDPIVQPKEGALSGSESKMPFWRSRIIALYIDWAKTFTTFRQLPHSDKVALITNHASSYMIMCEAFRTPEHVNDKIVHPDGHCFTRQPPPGSIFEKNSAFGDDDDDGATPATNPQPDDGGDISLQGPKKARKAPPRSDSNIFGTSGFDGLSGLTPVMAAMIDYVMRPFRALHISTTEFAALQAVMFFDPDTDGLDSASQRNVAMEQKKLLVALHLHISARFPSSEAQERYASILLRIPTIRKVAAKKNESLQIIDIFNTFALNSLVKETALGKRRLEVANVFMHGTTDPQLRTKQQETSSGSNDSTPAGPSAF